MAAPASVQRAALPAGAEIARRVGRGREAAISAVVPASAEARPASLAARATPREPPARPVVQQAQWAEPPARARTAPAVRAAREEHLPAPRRRAAPERRREPGVRQAPAVRPLAAEGSAA